MKRLSAWATALLGLALRLPNVGWGLPDVAEEAYPMKKALDMWGWQAGTIEWNPQTIGWPSLSFYAHLLLQHLHYGVGRLSGQFDQRLDYLVAFAADHHDLIILSRMLGVLASCGIIFLAARLAQKMVGTAGGWLAGLLLAVSPMMITHAHLINPDILLTFFAALATVACVNVYLHGRRRDYLLAGLWIGLGISCKYTPILLFAPLFGAHLLARRRDNGRISWSDLPALDIGIAVAAGFLAFMITSPFFFTDGTVLGRDVSYQLLHLKQGHFGHGAFRQGPAYYLVNVLAPGLGWPAFLLAVSGLGIMSWRRRGEWLVLALCFLCFYVPLSLASTQFDRYMLPVLLPLAVGFSAWAILLQEFLKSRDLKGRWVLPTATMLATLVLLATSNGALSYHKTISCPSTLHLARDYILDLPGHPILAMESYTPQLQDEVRKQLYFSDDYQLLSESQKAMVKLDDRTKTDFIPMYSTRVELAAYYYDLRHYQPYTHVVVSSDVRGRYLAEPDQFPEQVRFYSDLDRFTHLVKQFSSEDGYSGPEISIYDLQRTNWDGLAAKRGKLEPNFHRAYTERLHSPHFQGFLRGVAYNSDQAELFSHAALYYDILLETSFEAEASPKRLAWLERSSYNHLRAAEFARSVHTAEIYLKFDPNSIRVWSFLGQASAGVNDIPRARTSFERCLEIAAPDPSLKSWEPWAREQLAKLPDSLIE